MTAFLCIVLGYVLGSAPWGLVIARTFCGIDPRNDGSRNTGATNVARLCGFRWGVLTLACDLGKGALPVALALWLGLSPLLVTCVALACVLGHVFSCFMGFRGGKAVATSIGVFLPLAFFPLLFSCAACVLVIWRSGFVSLGSLTLVTVLPFALLAATKYAWVPLSLCIWALVVWKHKENIARLRAVPKRAGSRAARSKTAQHDSKRPLSPAGKRPFFIFHCTGPCPFSLPDRTRPEKKRLPPAVHLPQRGGGV